MSRHQSNGIPDDERLMQIAKYQEIDHEHALSRVARIKGLEAKYASVVTEQNKTNHKHLKGKQ